jgi:hypothetical protein
MANFNEEEEIVLPPKERTRKFWDLLVMDQKQRGPRSGKEPVHALCDIDSSVLFGEFAAFTSNTKQRGANVLVSLVNCWMACSIGLFISIK